MLRRVIDVSGDERLSDHRDTIDDSRWVDLGACRDRARRFKTKVAGKDPQAAQHDAFGLWQQLVAPVECGPQCPMPRRCGSMAAGQQMEPVVQPQNASRDSECSAAGGCQLDR
jgi:hypothetical protein